MRLLTVRRGGHVLIAFCCALLAACAAAPKLRMTPATYDLSGGAPDISFTQGRLLAGVDVFSTSWLADDAMYYRLNYVDPTGRFAFAETQWSGPIAEQIAVRMQRSLPDQRSGICRLRIDIDDLIQEFQSPGDSSVLLNARATLYAARPSAAPYQHAFRITRKAPSATAQGGVQAAQEAVTQLAREIDRWLAAAQEKDPNFIQRCK